VLLFLPLPPLDNLPFPRERRYYKGLGTSSSAEAKEYFKAIKRHRIDFDYEGATSDESIKLAFERNRADERKTWLQAVKEGTFVDYGVSSMSYSEFVNKELVLFSQADNVRSIPSYVDGLKPSQRKVLFGCFRRKLREEIKVAQLAGYVSEHSM
jgi:DNA topoisomerase-2